MCIIIQSQPKYRALHVLIVAARYICVVICLESDPSMPSQQLSDLKRVLQSDFFKSVREVYEHIYQTVQPQGNTDIRAHATAKVSFSIVSLIQSRS